MKKLFHYLKIIPEIFSYLDTFFEIPKNSFTANKKTFLLWQCSIVIVMCCIFFYYSYQIHNELFYIINENNNNERIYYVNSMKNLITTGITLFGTLLALYWTSVIGALSIQYASINHAVKKLFFKLIKSKLTTLLTSCYLIANFFIYIVINYNMITPTYIFYIFYLWVIITTILMCLYSYLAVEIFKYIDSYQLYHNLSQKIYINFYHIAYWHDKSFFKPSINKIHESISLQHNIISYGIYKEFLIPSETIKFLIDTLQLITLYWKKKKTICYNCDWYFSVQRQNSLSEIIFTGNNSMLAKCILQIETWLFELNKLIVNYLMENKNFFLLSLYYDEIRKILSLEERENLLAYNVPFFYETLNTFFIEIESYFKFSIKDFTKENEKDISYYGLISNLNNVLGNIFMTNQAYLFKFDKAKVNTVIPAYEEIIQLGNIQDLLIKYPTVNNEIGLKNYTKLFIEKNVEHTMITSKEKYFKECNLPLIQTELKNILRLFQSIEEILQENLTFFAEQNSPHYFLDTLYTFLSIKHEFLMNYIKYQANYTEYFTNPTEKDIITSKVQLLFNFYKELPNQLTSIIKIYRNEKYFTQKEFPNLLNNIYNLLLSLLIFYFNSENISFQKEKRNTIKITFHFMLTVQQILTLELEELKKEQITIFAHYDENFYINYYSAFIQFAAIIGSGLQKIENNNLYDINSTFSDILAADDIRNYFQPMVHSIFHNNTVSFHFYPLIQPIEHEMQSQNSLIFFLKFIQAKLKEYGNDK